MENEKTRDDSRSRRRNGSRLVFGGFLMLLGALLIAENLGFEVPMSVWSYWPFLLIALGAAKLVLDEGDGRSSGFWLLLSGIYGWICVFGIAGLTWGTAWPIYLLGLGFWIVIGRVVCHARIPRIGEKSDVR